MIAPTGTIGLVMDCDTTGIEPDFALVKFKKLAGGGYFKIINRMVPTALATARLRGRADRRRSCATRSATARWSARPQINHETLAAKGFTRRGAGAARAARCRAPSTSSFVFNHCTLGEGFCRDALGITRRAARRPRVRPARRALGFSRDEIRGRQRALLRRDDGRGRAAPEGPSTCRCSTAPTPAAGSAGAISRPRATSG